MRLAFDGTFRGRSSRCVAAALVVALALLLSASLPATGTAVFQSDEVVIALTEDSVARYRVREQLVNIDFPSDAVGETSAVEGRIVFGGQGEVQRGSEIRVDLTTLESDQERRDRYLRSRTLGTDEYPRARFTAESVSGLPWPLPRSGEYTFEIAGGFTVRDTTAPATWTATATFGSDRVSGTATTEFTFGELGLERPSVAFVLSVEDQIRLEIDFVASIRSSPPASR